MPVLGLAKGSTIKKLTENFKVSGAHQGIADIMKQGQFQALHALRVQKGFQDCKTENGACELEIAAALRAVHSIEADNEVPGAVEYLEAVVQGKLGSVAQERDVNSEGRVRELEEWRKGQPTRFTACQTRGVLYGVGEKSYCVRGPRLRKTASQASRVQYEQ